MRVNIESLIGETVKFIDSDGEDVVMLTLESGRQIKIYHEQDCCEYVRIVDENGDWHKLVGKVIIAASHESKHSSEDESYESKTETTLTFHTDKDTVISEWIGTSNGYYSEEVNLEELTERED